MGDALVAARHMNHLNEGIMFGSLKSLLKAQLRILGDNNKVHQTGRHICTEEMLLAGVLEVYMLIQQRAMMREK